MQQRAIALLAVGVLLMSLGLAMSATAMTDMSTHLDQQMVSSLCLNCHTDAHPDFVATPVVRLVHLPQTGTHATNEPGACLDCHDMRITPAMLDAGFTTHIENVQQRVHDLQAALDDLYRLHPGWTETTGNRSERQITAEYIATLIQYIKADGSWGFHHAAYTDSLLIQAETLLTDLTVETTQPYTEQRDS